MKANIGTIDRVMRVIIAALIAILFFSGRIQGGWGIVLLIVAAVFVITSFLGFCPIYHITGFRGTRRSGQKA